MTPVSWQQCSTSWKTHQETLLPWVLNGDPSQAERRQRVSPRDSQSLCIQRCGLLLAQWCAVNVWIQDSSSWMNRLNGWGRYQGPVEEEANSSFWVKVKRYESHVMSNLNDMCLQFGLAGGCRCAAKDRLPCFRLGKEASDWEEEEQYWPREHGLEGSCLSSSRRVQLEDYGREFDWLTADSYHQRGGPKFPQPCSMAHFVIHSWVGGVWDAPSRAELDAYVFQGNHWLK